MSRILIVDDDVAICRTLQLHLGSQGHKVLLAHDAQSGLEAVEKYAPDLVIMDIRMPGLSGLEALPEMRARAPDTPVLMVTAFHDMDTTISAMKRGAIDYIHKPLDIDEMDAAVKQALGMSDINNGEVRVGVQETSSPGTNIMVGRGRAMREVFKIIGLVAPKAVTILITGESGTGKELVARAIHAAGSHPDGPFVAVNCAAIVDTLLESDLFGHEKGAFTGAANCHAGKFALAHNGTIFLDEVGELSTSVQAKLLRVLQEREFVPVGGTRVEHTNARVIAATNVSLMEKVAIGAFREDLYYRLQVVTIQTPPLRDRREDIVDLVDALLSRINRDMDRNVTLVAKDVMEAFQAYEWPGNVRELANVLTKAVALCRGEIINRELLPEKVIEASLDDGQQLVSRRMPPALASLDEIERYHVAQVLATTNWHRGETCRVLGISRPRLRRLIKHHHLAPGYDTE